MIRVLLQVIALGGVIFALPACAGGSAVTGLCSAQETKWLACATTRQRWLGLCGTGQRALQYRFGRPGAVELRVPADPADGTSLMVYAHYTRFQTDRVEIRFDNEGAEYVLFDYTEGRARRAGVRVTTTDGKERELACVGRITSRLGELRGLLKCDTDSALNGGQCP